MLLSASELELLASPLCSWSSSSDEDSSELLPLLSELLFCFLVRHLFAKIFGTTSEATFFVVSGSSVVEFSFFAKVGDLPEGECSGE